MNDTPLIPLGKVCDVPLLFAFPLTLGFAFDGVGSCSICDRISSMGGALAAGGSSFSCSNLLNACKVMSLTFFLFVSLVNRFCY